MLATVVSVGDAESSRDAEQGPHDHLPAGGGGTLAFRDDKQETIVVRPYPQVQAHGQPQATPQALPIQSGTPVTVAAPSVHLPQGQPAVLTDGQMKVMCFFPRQLLDNRYWTITACPMSRKLQQNVYLLTISIRTVQML